MEVSSSAAMGLVDASLNLLGKLWASYKEHGKDSISDGVRSIQGDLESIKEALSRGSEEQQGSSLSWINNLRSIKRRIEDVMELYDLEFAGQQPKHFEGLGARVVDKLLDKGKRVVGPGRHIHRFLKEIESLSARAKNRLQIADGGSRQPETCQQQNAEDFCHDKEAEPVGLEAPRNELVQILSMNSATMLRVVSIVASPDGDNKLARAAYDNVQSKEAFDCKAWVTAPSSYDGDGKRLLKDMIDRLGQQRQHGKSFSHLAQILRDFLKNKRYIIGIDSLETTRCWNDLLRAFPDDTMGSRIIVTTTKDEIAKTCQKNCPVVYRMRPALDTKLAQAELLQILCEGTTARKRRVVTVCGPGGSGKSILARAAYDQVTEKEQFEFKAWAVASNDNNGRGLLLDILRRLGRADVGEENISQLTDILKGLLQKGRYIVVMDGLETTGYLNNVLNACPDNNKSNRIIVTTASNRVTNICQGNGPVYKMRPLDNNSAKHLLGKKVMFPRNNVDRDRLMTMILETCEYLPLAIANMGDYMRSLNKTWNYAECEKACTDIGSLLVNNQKEALRGMKHVVNRSYNSLNDNAKTCLLSLCIYLKNLVIEDHVIRDHVIKGKPLIRRLLAERLISLPSSSSVDDLANECFTELIEQNFIVPVEVSISGQVKTFRVNRMLPLFIHEKGQHENYVTRLNIRQGQELLERSSSGQADVTRLYLSNNSSKPPRIGEKAITTHVRLLTYHGEASKALMDLNNYMFLRVLIVENCENLKDEHLHTICSRPVLRYLSIRGSQHVTMLPANIVNMRSLETLDTRNTKVHKIPMEVILLLALLHLFGTKIQIVFKNRIMFPKNSKVQKVAKFIPNGNPLGNLFEGKRDIPVESSKLQTLAGFLVDEVPYFVTLLLLLPRMPMLSKLRFSCGQTAPNEMVTKQLLESLKSCLKKEVKDRNYSPLHSLTVDFHGCTLNFMDNLEIQPPCSLRSLKLCGKLTRLPRFILSLTDSLQELCLSETNLGCPVLLELSHLKKLQFLKLTGAFFELEQLVITFEPYWFCSLQRICLDAPKVPKIVVKDHAMEGLESLQLVCNELGGVSGILNLKRLKEVVLSARVSRAGADDLLKQVSKHSMKPKLVYAHGSSRHKSDTN